MSWLSTVPRVIVLAMQVSLAALVILATVPIVMGGVDVDVTEDPEITYEDHELKFTMEFVIDTNLYFDITGFYYGVYLKSGGQTLTVKEEDIGTLKHTTVRIEEGIPLVVLAMMMVYGAAGDGDTVITVEIGGSTLMGMISVSVKVDTVVAEAGSSTVTMNADGSELNAEFTVPPSLSGILDDIFDEIAGELPATIKIGDTEVTVDIVKEADGSYTVTVDAISSPGSTLIEDLEAALAALDADGNITIEINGIEYKLAKEDVDFIISILGLLMGGI